MSGQKAIMTELKTEAKRLSEEVALLKGAKSVKEAAADIISFIQKSEGDPLTQKDNPWIPVTRGCCD